jgi:hypothetical protein
VAKKLLHYGLQRSGTNFLASCLEGMYKVHILNHKADRNDPLNKHFRLYNEKGKIPEIKYANKLFFNNFDSFEKNLSKKPDYYIIISKNPYSWLVSYRKWGKKCHWPEVDHHYIEEYNLFYNKWLDFSQQTDKIFFVRYIDLLTDREIQLRMLGDYLGVKQKLFSFLLPYLISKVPQSKTFTDDKRDYYIHKRYLNLLSKDEIEVINSILDNELIEKLGYEFCDI